MAKEKKYRYSEMFSSIQGEGKYTGVPTLWIRLWGCNFECHGFGQENLDEPDTWIIPALDFDPKSVKTMEELPVWEYGCDSSYTYEKTFRHLAHIDTVSVIVDKLTDLMRNKYNPNGLFKHPDTGQEMHFAITGGEPMMSQAAMVAIIEEFSKRENAPAYVTVETNGTQPIKDKTMDLIWNHRMTSEYSGLVDDARGNTEWFWSCSPKLRASGEKWKDAILPDVLEKYDEASERGQLKFVVDGSSRTWDEVARATKMYRERGINWPVYIMAVGATKESQETDQVAKIALETIERGYIFTGRLHCAIFGNKIGT